jgi:Putative DNA-binding domain
MLKINLETFDLTQLPALEDDSFEFKSSKTPFNKLKDKINQAVSGFANSGGGYFIAGVDENGNADGGFFLKVERQDLRDWIDNIVNQVEPVPKYEIKLIEDPAEKGVIEPNSAVIIIAIYESYFGPHMAPDKHYYIRAGAHTVKAKHFIIEAVWAKRHFSKPRLTHLFRLKPGKEQIVQLGILALTKDPAIDIKISILPLPKMMENLGQLFPLEISLIDRENPFFFDISLYGGDHFGSDIQLEVEYYDVSANFYVYKTPIEIKSSVPPIRLGNDNFEKAVKALEKIEKTLLGFEKSRENIVKSNFIPPRTSDAIFSYIQKLIPDLLEEMKNDLCENPFIREFIIIGNGWTYNAETHNKILFYYFEEHIHLRGKLRILENCGLIYEITYNDVKRFIFSEELVEYLINNSSGDESNTQLSVAQESTGNEA